MTRSFRRFARAASLLALAAATPALAQPVEPTELGEIVVTGSQVRLPPAAAGGQVATGGRVGLLGNLDVMDTPFSTSSYTEELIRNQQARSVSEVLQNDPSVRISKGFGNFQELYVIRGFPVFSDDMTYNGLYGVLPRQFVAAELLERVEVFRGATAFLNGAAPGGSGVGGAVNLVPKRAGNDPLTRLTAGWEGGDEIYAAADVSRRFGQDDAWGLRLNVASRDGESAIEGEEREMRVVGLGLDRRGDRARFSADLGWQTNRLDDPRPQVTPARGSTALPAAPSADKNFAQPWTYTDEEQLFGAVRGEFDVTGAITVWAAMGGRDGKERNSLANPTAQADGTLSGSRFDNGRRDQVFSADVGVRADFDTGPVSHRMVASAAQVQSREKNSFAFSSGYAAGTLDNPVYVPAPAVSGSGSLTDPGVVGRIKTTSFALADMLSFFDDRLIATVGARYQEIDSRRYDYNTGVKLNDQGYESDAVTPVLALVYRPIDAVSLYANYSEALLPGKTAPSVINGVDVVNGGEVLDPFRAEQAEIGAKFDAGSFGGTLSIFRTTLPSEYFDEDTGIYSAGGEQENRGVELSVFGEPIDGLRVLGGATWLDTEITRALDPSLQGKSAIGVPEFQVNANVEWDVPMLAGLTLEGRAVHTGSQAASGDNTLELDAWTRFDAGLRYAFEAGERPLTLRARVENVADEDQWVAVGGYPGSNYLTLGAPRTFRLSVSTEF